MEIEKQVDSGVAQSNTEATSDQNVESKGAEATEEGLLGAKEEGLLGGQGKEEGEKADVEGAPESYEDFKLPDDYEIDPELLSEFTGTAKELNLSQAKAQKLVDVMSKHTNALAEKQASLWQEQRKAWKNEVKSDKEFGGMKFSETVERANRSLSKFAEPSFVKYLKDSGLDNNSGLVKLLARVDKAIGEDKVEDGKALEAPLDPAEILFGGTK